MGKLIRRMGIPTFAVSALLLVVLIAASWVSHYPCFSPTYCAA